MIKPTYHGPALGIYAILAMNIKRDKEKAKRKANDIPSRKR